MPKKTVKPTEEESTAHPKAITPEVLPKEEPAANGTLAVPAKPKKPRVSITPQDPMLAAYFREISKYPLLSREEEHQLALKYFETKDRESLQRLVTANLRFVVKIAYEYIHYRVRLMDLIQEGNTGLVKAVQEFDPHKDVRLTTYAVWWIRSFIQEAILKNHSLVKMGTTQAQKKLFYHLKREQRRLEDMGISPGQNVKLLANRLDVREKDVEEMSQRLSSADLSLNAPVGDGDNKQHIENLASTQESAEEALGEAEERELFHRILEKFGKTLDGREKMIFQHRLTSEEPMTLQEIGDKYKVSKERARQLEEQVKEKLKTYVSSHFPDWTQS